MRKLIPRAFLLFVALSIPNLAMSKPSIEEMTLLVGSAIGAISSGSCGGQRQLGNNAKSAWIELLDKELSLGNISKQQRKRLDSVFTKMIAEDARIRHPAKTCKSAKKLVNRLSN